MEGLIFAERLLDMTQTLWLSALTNALVDLLQWRTQVTYQQQQVYRRLCVGASYVSEVCGQTVYGCGDMCVCVCARSLFVTGLESPPPQRHKRQINVT